LERRDGRLRLLAGEAVQRSVIVAGVAQRCLDGKHKLVALRSRVIRSASRGYKRRRVLARLQEERVRDDARA
jgi:hypothetical protein